MTWLYRAVVGLLGLKMANLLVNVRCFPVLSAGAPTGAAAASSEPSVSLLVPVRDEADRLPATLPGLLDQGVDEVIFLDDGSLDGSAELLAAAAAAGTGDGAGPGRVRVLRGAERPPGWAGKTWACRQLADAATSDRLVFCDADIELAAGALTTVAAEMTRQRADVFSVFPRQRTATLGEHLLVPLIDDVLLAFLPFPLLDVPAAAAAAAANGSLLAFEREAYDALGGFDAVRGEVVEDVAMARLTRRQGHRLGLALGGSLVQARMYQGWSQLVTGFARGLRPMAGGSSTRLLAGWAAHVVAYTLPALLAVSPRAARRRWAIPLVLAGAERLVVEGKTGRRRWWQALLMPVTPLAALPVVLRARRPVQTWKGREYS